MEPSEVKLKGISKELANSKSKVQTLVRPLMRSDNLAIAGKAHELGREADEVAYRGQKRICKLLRRLDINQEGSETSSARTSVATAQAPRTSMASREENLFFSKNAGGGDSKQQDCQGQMQEGMRERLLQVVVTRLFGSGT
jgi:hypothetical protein